MRGHARQVGFEWRMEGGYDSDRVAVKELTIHVETGEFRRF